MSVPLLLEMIRVTHNEFSSPTAILCEEQADYTDVQNHNFRANGSRNHSSSQIRTKVSGSTKSKTVARLLRASLLNC